MQMVIFRETSWIHRPKIKTYRFQGARVRLTHSQHAQEQGRIKLFPQRNKKLKQQKRDGTTTKLASLHKGQLFLRGLQEISGSSCFNPWFQWWLGIVGVFLFACLPSSLPSFLSSSVFAFLYLCLPSSILPSFPSILPYTSILLRSYSFIELSPRFVGIFKNTGVYKLTYENFVKGQSAAAFDFS